MSRATPSHDFYLKKLAETGMLHSEIARGHPNGT